MQLIYERLVEMKPMFTPAEWLEIRAAILHDDPSHITTPARTLMHKLGILIE